MIKFSVGPALIAAANAISVDRLGVDGAFIQLDLSNVGDDSKADLLDYIAADIKEEAQTMTPEHAQSLQMLASMVASKKALVRIDSVQSDTLITQDETTGSHSLPSGESVSSDSSTQSSVEENEEIEDGREAQDGSESEEAADEELG